MAENKKDKAKPSNEIVLARSHYWVLAAIFQGERLMSLIESQKSYDPHPSEWTEEQRRAWNAANHLGAGHTVEEVEGYFVMCALRHARRWLGYAEVLDQTIETVVEALDQVAPDAKDIRDMIEHEDAYLTGGGNYPEKYAVPYNGLPATAHGIVVHGNVYLIGGGRIDVQKTIDALKQVLPVVEDTRKRLAPPKPPTFEVRVNIV